MPTFCVINRKEICVFLDTGDSSANLGIWLRNMRDPDSYSLSQGRATTLSPQEKKSFLISSINWVYISIQNNVIFHLWTNEYPKTLLRLHELGETISHLWELIFLTFCLKYLMTHKNYIFWVFVKFCYWN